MLCCISVWYQCYVYVMPSCYVTSPFDISVMCMWCHHVMSHLDVMSVLCVCDAIMLCHISMWYQCYVYVMPSCYVASRCDVSVMCMWCHHVMLHLGVISVLCVCNAIMLCCISVYCHHIMLHLGGFRNFWEPLLKYENVVFNGEQKKESFVWGIDRKSVPWDHCHHLTSLLTVVLGMDLSILPSHSW